jgi:hypothetical protein
MRNKIVLCLVIQLLVLKSFAQVEGNVVDTTGKAIPGATIIAIDTVKNTTDTIKSDKVGYYSFKSLKRGNYKIAAMAEGFQNAIYKNVIVDNETPQDDSGEGDISNAVWLEIVLEPRKVPK